MTPWLEACRAAVGDIRGVLAELPTRVEREPVAKVGEGGDDTTAIDAAAEAVVLERLAAVGGDFVLVSEEIGEVAPRHFSFMGSLTAPGRLIKQTAPAAADLLVEDQVDIALLVPV